MKFILIFQLMFFAIVGIKHSDLIRENEHLRAQKAIMAIAEQMTIEQLTNLNVHSI